LIYSIATDSPSETLVSLLQHFASEGIEMVSSNLSDGVLTVSTDIALSDDFIEHLGLHAEIS
jgi:hypothetical protein